MRAMILTLGAAALSMGVVLTLPNAKASTGPIPLNCNRACLEGLVNQYLTALVAHNPFKGFNRPSSILVTEAFLIENQKIRRVEMVGNSTPYHTNSPWPGNLSGD